MFLFYDDCNKYYPYTISDECGTFMDCDLDDLIELKNLIENILANEANYDTNQTKVTKEKTKMEIKFMINWANQEVANIEEYNNEYVCDVAHNFEEDDEVFDYWLAERFAIFEVFNMSEEDKKKTRNDYKEYCRERANEELTEDGWEVCVMEI